LHNIETDFLIYGIELGDYLSPDGVSCRISSWTRQEDRSLPLRGKISGAYITSSLAKTEAVKSGFDEALLLNSRGKVSEASGMNLFIVRDGVLITPGVDQDILEGITRASVLELARQWYGRPRHPCASHRDHGPPGPATRDGAPARAPHRHHGRARSRL
jgi:branched-chain amino acid aminotransferase